MFTIVITVIVSYIFIGSITGGILYDTIDQRDYDREGKAVTAGILWPLSLIVVSGLYAGNMIKDYCNSKEEKEY